MDRKLLLLCLASGILCTIISTALIWSGNFYLIFAGSTFLPGFVFGFLISRYHHLVAARNRTVFVFASVVIYSVSALLSFFFDVSTNYVAMVILSAIGCVSILLVYNQQLKRLENLRQSSYTALIGRLFAGVLVALFIHLIETKESTNPNGESVAVKLHLARLAIFPLWQTAFGIAAMKATKNAPYSGVSAQGMGRV